MPLFPLAVASTFFYLSLRELNISSIFSFMYTLLLTLFPYFYFQTIIGYIDTPGLILMFYTIIIWSSIKVINYDNYKKYLFIMCFCFFSLALFWNRGSYIIIFINSFAILYPRCYRVIKNKKLLYIGFIILGLIFVSLFFNKFLDLLSIKSIGLVEYQTPTYFIYYLIVLVVVLMYSKLKTNSLIIQYLVIGSALNLCLSLIMVRFTTFALLFMILLIAKLQNKKKIINYLITIIIIINITMITTTPLKPQITREYEQLLKQIPNGTKIYNPWDMGHIISYITKKNIQFKAHPTPKALLTIEQILYNKNNNQTVTTPHYLIYSFKEIPNKINTNKYIFVNSTDKQMIIKTKITYKD